MLYIFSFVQVQLLIQCNLVVKGYFIYNKIWLIINKPKYLLVLKNTENSFEHLVSFI